jgi:hypothetical protein
MKYLVARVLLALAMVWCPSTWDSAAQTLPPSGVLQCGQTSVIQIAPGQEASLEVPLHIAPGFHVQANPASNEFLVPLEFSLIAPESGVVQDWRVSYPLPDRMRLEGTSEDLMTYSDRITVGVRLRVANDTRPGRHELQAQVRYQACNDRRCLFPDTVAMSIPIEVTEPSTDRLLRIRLPELEHRYGGDAGRVTEALSVEGRLPVVVPARVTVRIEAIGRHGSWKCPWRKEPQPIFAHLHAAGRLYGTEFASGCLSDSVISEEVEVDLHAQVEALDPDSREADELVLWWTGEHPTQMTDQCWLAGGEYDVDVRRVEILVEPR